MDDIGAKAEHAGLEPSYTDIWGNRHTVPDETIRHIYEHLRLPLEEALENTLPHVKVLPALRSNSFLFPHAISCEIIAESGDVKSCTASQQMVELPPLAMGYYRLRIQADKSYECKLIIAPPTCWMPEELYNGRRVWGFATQLYSVRSENNWGMGDYGDLRDIVTGAAKLGADVIGLNPVHALFPANPEHFSPYSPSNRLFLNTLYIDVTAVDNFHVHPEVRALWNDARLQQVFLEVRAKDHVDYVAVANLKKQILHLLHTSFAAGPADEAYSAFQKARGIHLQQQALFDALCEHFHRENGHFVAWWHWPEAYRSPDSETVRQFAQTHAQSVDFYCWLQWIADTQLATTQTTALSQGMRVGLYRDLAVGCDKAGAEVWTEPDNFISGVTIGAPPDEYNINGQNWGLPPFNPLKLKQLGYEPFIRLLHANMRHARALRIDHAFGLARLFLIPEGKDASHGAYLRYPFDDLLAIIRLESHRQQCIIIGEDLGTFPPGYKERAADSGILSYKVCYFEREHDRQFTPPQRYPEQALATLSTHDLPTLKGWISSTDIDERERLGLYPNPEITHKDRQDRARDIKYLAVALHREGLLNSADAPITFEAVQRYLSRGPSVIVMMQLEDILGIKSQVNLPATTNERPNWLVKLPENVNRLFRKDGVLVTLASAMNEERSKPVVDVPRATYRLQFHKDFTFCDAARILPYLKALGISHVYASPYLKARPGSMHGYDITGHHALNPELGGEEGYAVFLESLAQNELKQILDFVPNHMGVGGSDNKWWLGVLEWGQDSPYASYFDIDWMPRYPGASAKLIVPFLGEHYGDALDKGELKLAFDMTEGSFSVWYAEHRFPICPRDYHFIDNAFPSAQTPSEGEDSKTFIRRETHMHAALITRINEINNDRQALHDLLERQHYILAFWRTAASTINYRRFFDISDLAGVRPEVPALFDAMHERVLSLIHQGKLHGLRIDHIDGLADPEGYCHKLRERAGGQAYITVEKILGDHETLPQHWRIQGTSGYDALNMIGGIFVDRKAEKIFDRIYRRFADIEEPLEEIIYSAKILILETTLASELEALSQKLHRITTLNRYTRDYPLDLLRDSLKEIIGLFHVYRTYITSSNGSETDTQTVERAIARAKKRSDRPDISVYDTIESMLLLKEKPVRANTADFVRKFQQLSGPVMAKGVEDTAFYRYSRFIGLNEVGGNPGYFGMSAKGFHHTNVKRAAQMPDSMLSTATHDTKRGEDMRARLYALSEMPQEWSRLLKRWSVFNRSRRVEKDGKDIPSSNEEYFIYQMLLGSWPMELFQTPLDANIMASYLKRLNDYLIKALREAKIHSGWSQPDNAYETSVQAFMQSILDTSGPNLFLDDMLTVVRRLTPAGAVNSLSQTVLKLTLPGIPDIYQGTEYWDLSFVDPDNRRPVNYEQRRCTLEKNPDLPELLSHWADGAVKQGLIAALLLHRLKNAELYRYGRYIPLNIKGTEASHALGFVRKHKGSSVIVIIPLRISKWLNESSLKISGESWENTYVSMPCNHYRNILTGETYTSPLLSMADCFARFPCAVFELD